MVTKAEFLFMIQSINLPPSAHTITFSAHCRSHYVFSVHTAAAITSSVCTLQQPLHLQCTHCSSHYIFSAHTAAVITSSVCTLQQPLHLQCTHCSSHYIFSVHTAAAITSSVHTLQQPLHLQCTLQPCTAMYSYLRPTFSAHCSHVQPCTAMCSQSSVHTAANCSHLQPPTLQLYYPVHTAAILSSAHCSYSIQCTL